MLDAQHSTKSLQEQLLRAQAQLSEAAAAKKSAEAAAQKLRAFSEHSASTALAAAEARCADLEERLRTAQAHALAGQLPEATHAAKDSAGNGPPAMAGPGVPRAPAPRRFTEAAAASRPLVGWPLPSGKPWAGEPASWTWPQGFPGKGLASRSWCSSCSCCCFRSSTIGAYNWPIAVQHFPAP